MGESLSLWPLIGIAAIVVGFVLRFNPVLVVIVSGIITGLTAHMPIATILEKLGEGFLNTRNLPFILLLPLAVIGLLERHGLKERAQTWIAKIRSATAGRLLIVYLFVREVTAAMGLTSLGGHPQMVRLLLAPMAEGAAEKTSAPCPARCAIVCARCRRRPTTWACSSGKIFSLPSGRLSLCITLCWSRAAFRPSRCISPCGDPNGGLRLPDPLRPPVAPRPPSPARAGQG